jgi:uncharacterized protein (TIGR00661 family)
MQMATIFYSLAGEGRGHATRVRSIVEELRHVHDIHIFTSNQAFDLLRPIYRGTEIKVRKIPGFAFSYDKNGKLDYLQTFIEGLKTLAEFPKYIRYFQDKMNRHKPDLVITDFEPILPRAALRCDIPYISIDHQHFLTHYDLSHLPARLKGTVEMMSSVVRLFYSDQRRTVISSFYFPPLKAKVGQERVDQVGVLLRPEIRYARPILGSHYTIYLRRNVPEEFLQLLQNWDRPIHLFGLGARPRRGKMEFRKIDAMDFANSLITCKGLVSTAGNQLLGEALYLQKRILVFPEPGNEEQEVNGHFLNRTGAGLSTAQDSITLQLLRSFDARPQDSFVFPTSESICANERIAAIIEEELRLIAMLKKGSIAA